MTALGEQGTRRSAACGPRPVNRLVVLGDSTAVGLGDPVPGGDWRGVGPLLAEALNVGAYRNVAFTGARVRCVRTVQLEDACAFDPDVVVLVVGMNDTLRSDFDPSAVHADLDRVVGTLRARSAEVLTVRFHDHGRVFRLPGPLRRALRARIDELNRVTDVVTRTRGARCLDLDTLPGTYELDGWSVDRLHPSERGHRLLARGFTELLAEAGVSVPRQVSLRCSGGARPGRFDHFGWLVARGIPWLCRRGRDLLPYAAAVLARSALEGVEPRIARCRTAGSQQGWGCRTNRAPGGATEPVRQGAGRAVPPWDTP